MIDSISDILLGSLVPATSQLQALQAIGSSLVSCLQSSLAKPRRRHAKPLSDRANFVPVSWNCRCPAAINGSVSVMLSDGPWHGCTRKSLLSIQG